MQRLNKKNRIIKGAIFLFIGKILNVILAVVQILLIPRLLGPKSMGFYSFWLSVYFITARILGLGGQHIIIKYVPELRIKNELMIPTLLKKVVNIKFPLFFIIICLGLLFWSTEPSYFIIIVSAALLFSLNLAAESVFYSYNIMGTYALISLIRTALRITLVLILFYAFYKTGIVLGILGAPLIALSLSIFLLSRILPRNHVALDQPFRKHFNFGFWIYLSIAIQGMVTWLIIILSKIYIKDIAIIGYFGVGVQLFLNIGMLVYFINESILPSLVEFSFINDNKFKSSLRLAWKYTNILLFPTVLGGYVLTGPMVLFIIGKNYIPGTTIIRLFFLPIIFMSWIKFHTQILFVYKKKIAIFLTELINLLIFVGTWFYLICQKNIDITPLSLCLGTLAAYLFILIHSNQIIKIEKYFSNFLKPLIASSLMAFILNLFKVNSIIQLLSLVLLGFLLYVLFLFLLKGIGKADFKLIKEFLKSTKIFRVEEQGF